MDYQNIIKIFKEKLHVEIDTLCNSDGISEEDIIIGRIRGVIDCIKYIAKLEELERISGQ